MKPSFFLSVGHRVLTLPSGLQKTVEVPQDQPCHVGWYPLRAALLPSVGSRPHVRPSRALQASTSGFKVQAIETAVAGTDIFASTIFALVYMKVNMRSLETLDTFTTRSISPAQKVLEGMEVKERRLPLPEGAR